MKNRKQFLPLRQRNESAKHMAGKKEQCMDDVGMGVSRKILNEIVYGQNDSQLVERVSKNFKKAGEEKAVNYAYSFDWINPITENKT